VSGQRKMLYGQENTSMYPEYGCNLCRPCCEDFPKGKRVWELLEYRRIGLTMGIPVEVQGLRAVLDGQNLGGRVDLE
jgi:hypothetical protein